MLALAESPNELGIGGLGEALVHDFSASGQRAANRCLKELLLSNNTLEQTPINLIDASRSFFAADMMKRG